MSIQAIIVGICVIIAIIFMAKKFYYALTRKSACDCDSASSCRKINCTGYSQCSKAKPLEEIFPKR